MTVYLSLCEAPPAGGGSGAIHNCYTQPPFRVVCVTDLSYYLQKVGILFEFVYDLYFLKQFIESNLFLLRVYTSSWLYVTVFPFFVTKVMIVFVPIKDLRITNLFVVMLFTLFDIVS